MSRRRTMVMAIVAVVVAGVLGGALAAVWADSQTDRYSVTAVMAVAPSSAIIDESQVIDILNSLDRGGATATAAGIASSASVRDAAVEQLGLAPGSIGGYEVDSVPVLTSSLVDITVSGPDPDVTAALANAIGAQLQTRLTELYAVYDVVFLTQANAPPEPSRPNALLVTILGGLVAAGAAAAVTWSAFGGRWRQPQPTSSPTRADHPPAGRQPRRRRRRAPTPPPATSADE